MHPKRFQPVEDRCALVLDGVLRVQPQPGETLEQRCDADLRLGSGERRTEAEMRTAAKREMRSVLAHDIETVRVGMPSGVVSRREQRTCHRLTRLHRRAADLCGLKRKASDLHHRRIVAQHLLDCIGHELGMSSQPGELVRVPKQRQCAIADQIGGGEIPGDQQQVAGYDNLALRQAITRLLDGDELADQIGTAPPSPRLDGAREIIVEPLHRGPQLGCLHG